MSNVFNTVILSRGAFWRGVLVGIVLACLLDLTDLHICIGECDSVGHDIIGPRK